MNAFWLAPLGAYLLGSIPFGFLIVKQRQGGDIRNAGSGNIGATNVSRVAGPLAGMVTLLLDGGKGYLAVWAAGRMTGGNIKWVAAAGLAAIIGHLYPVWIGFRGGKGVATAVGVFVPICWQAVGAAALLWLAVVGTWRYISLGSIVAAAALPLLTYLLYAPGYAPPHSVSAATALAAALIILKHRSNLERLLQGNENRLGASGAKR
jgi:glycerol-3-phosphate acyltransferase PlsY